MQLPIVIAVLAAFIAAQSTGNAASLPAWRLAIVGVAGLLGPLTAWIGCMRLAARLPGAGSARSLTPGAARAGTLFDFAAHCESLERWVFGLWLLGILAMLSLGQWMGVVHRLGNIRALPLCAELAALAPVIGSLVAIWAAFYWLEARLRWAPTTHRVQQTNEKLLRFLWWQARQQLGLLVVPPLAIAGIAELAAWAGVGGGAWSDGQAGMADGWWVIAMPLGIVLTMPLWLRRLWKTTPLPEGALRQELLGHCQARRCPVSQVLLWHTGMRQANAAVVGFWPRLRYVLLSDRLLALLTRGELLAVLRHELSHLKRGHLLLRLAALMLPVAGWLALSPSDGREARLAGPKAEVATPDVEHVEVAHSPLGLSAAPAARAAPRWASLAFPTAMLAYCVLLVGGYSRWLEHEADWEACLDDQGQFAPWAAEDLADALRVVVGREESGWLTSWLHPPLLARLEFLNRAQHDPAFVQRFRWRLRGVALLLVVCWLAAGWALLAGR